MRAIPECSCDDLASYRGPISSVPYLSVMCIQQMVDVVHHWDAMADLVRKRVDWLMANVPMSVRGWDVLAAFVIKRSIYQKYEGLSIKLAKRRHFINS